MKDFAVLIGRFQPVHKGHSYIIKQAFKHARQLIIVIGSSFGSRTLRNSFTAAEREDMILGILKDPEFSDISDIESKVHFVCIKDYIYDKGDKLWIEDATNGVSDIASNIAGDNNKSVLLIGHEKDNTSYYLKNFPDWEYLECDNFEDINSTDIRERFFAGDLSLDKNMDKSLNNSGYLKSLKVCHESTLTWLKGFQAGEIFARLHKEYVSMKDYKKLWSGSPFAPIFVTCDALVIYGDSLLLIKRKHFPGEGLNAMPGGFIEADEKIIDGIIRELYEETKIDVPKEELLRSLQEVKAFDDPKRSTRGRIITHVGLFVLNRSDVPFVKGADDAESASWILISDFLNQSEQVFSDHYQIISWFLRNYNLLDN
jgi:bifunctional NMN adenylyltransferase/nudix hydrolase